MSLSSLTGDGSIGGDGSVGGDGSIGGDGSTGTPGNGRVSANTPGALITTRDGIVGAWTPPAPGQGASDAPADDGKQMRHWEARVRAHVLDFELLSSFRLEMDTVPASTPGAPDAPVAKLYVRERDAEPLVQLVRPSADYLLENQLAHVYNSADLRRDRLAEILSQIKGIDIFVGAHSPFHPERHRFTFELLAAFFRAIVSVEMRIKHALAVPRPVEFSWQLTPMIQTPGHGSFPAGHAVESFMLATVLSALMQAGNTRYDRWEEQFARLAARISVNRVIAGVHFPIDLAAGLVLGLTVGRYFVALATGGGAVTPCTFVGEAYADSNFPWEKFPWTNILKPYVELPPFVTKAASIPLAPRDKANSPLRWMWCEAVKEWK